MTAPSLARRPRTLEETFGWWWAPPGVVFAIALFVYWVGSVLDPDVLGSGATWMQGFAAAWILVAVAVIAWDRFRPLERPIGTLLGLVGLQVLSTLLMMPLVHL